MAEADVPDGAPPPSPPERVRHWTPWLLPDDLGGSNSTNPELELSLTELARYVAPEALGDVRWADVPNAEAPVANAPLATAQAKDAAMVVRLYERLARQPVAFWREPWLPGQAGQRIRHPWLLVHGRAGTCLDFATTYAAMCLDATLPPLLAMTWGRATGQHVFVIATPGRKMRYLDPPAADAKERFDELEPLVTSEFGQRVGDFGPGFGESAEKGVVRLEDWDAFENALQTGAMLAVDFDRGPDEPGVPFDEAGHRARAHLATVRARGAGLWLVDVAWLQHRGYPPLPPPQTRAPISRFIPGGRASFDAYKSRKAIVKELRDMSGTVVLFGASGTGKSTIAREIAFGAQFGAAWFLTASETQALINSLDQAEGDELGRRIDPSAHVDRKGFATNGRIRLARAEDEWVVVVDNADGDPDDLLPWLPSPNPNKPDDVRQLVLITTTNSAWRDLRFDFRVLEPVASEEAVKHLPGPELEPMVGGRPLLFEAFNRMSAGTGWDGARIALHAPPAASVAPEQLGPATLWAAARATDGFDDATLEVAAGAAYLPPDRQPLDVAIALAPEYDARAARATLTGLGLLSVDIDGTAVRMHRLVGAAVRADLEAHEPALVQRVVTRIATTQAATKLLDTNGDLRTITHLEDWLERRDLPDSEPDEQLGRSMHGIAKLLELHGHTRRSGERYAKAERHLRGVPLLLGLGLHGRARTVNQHYAGDSTRVREALGWAREAESLLRGADAADKAERCVAMQGLLMQKLAKLPADGETQIALLHEALEVIERADALRRARLAAVDPDNPELLRSWFNRAGVRIELAQAEPDRAEEHLDRAHDVYRDVELARRRIYARDEHPHIAACVIGRAYVAYFRALLVAIDRRARTTYLREATDRTIQALQTRQGEEGGTDGDEVAKVVRFLVKVALARDALVTSARGDSDKVGESLGKRFGGALEEILGGLAGGR
ncbi:MAG TPA: ATP-binding protein [Solirubrobacteraceae bacterium]|jgi:tetratricopeptide (TPR) repeat protein|nr:ATP-binding protein [Solirubrobacteraceae bacterium]